MTVYGGPHMYEPSLIPKSLIPENKEFPMFSLSSKVTQNSLFYIRNHMPYPELVDLAVWRLSIKGCVHSPTRLHYEDLLAMPRLTLPVTLECAGNKRALFDPKARGEQWELGAVSHAVWTGVPLRYVLSVASIQSNAIEVIFEGQDIGPRTDLPGTFTYARSLPLHKALHPDTMLAIYMNGKPLPFRHGFPLRLIVPGWYGMASVKWLRRIIVSDRPFNGPFQTRDYVLLNQPHDYDIAIPVSTIPVNSVIAYPIDQQMLRRGTYRVYGVAWGGTSTAKSIQVSVDGGTTWRDAIWIDGPVKYSWRRWMFNANLANAGKYIIMAKATDDSGKSQPNKATWNVKGYMNNSVHMIHVYVD